MDTLGALESFVSAVQTGSLSAAARQRKISQPAISQQIRALEARFGTRLLHRARSGVRMTGPGEELFKHATGILEQMQALEQALENLAGKVAGTLTVTANIGLSQHVLSKVIVQLAEQHPELQVLLRAEERHLDLVSEGIDLALRAGKLGNGPGMARKIATLTMLHVATPAYLDAHGRPGRPEDLANLEFIQYSPDSEQIATLLGAGEQTMRVPIRTGLTAQLPELIFQSLHANLGYAKAPRALVSRALQEGELEEILPEWRLPEVDLYLVYPARETRSPRVMAFLRVLFSVLESSDGIHLAASARQMLQDAPAGPAG